MAEDSKISTLTPLETISDSDVFAVVDDWDVTTKQIRASDVKDYMIKDITDINTGIPYVNSKAITGLGIGAGLSLSGGTLSVNASSLTPTLTPATTATYGVVKVGTGLTVSSGTISLSQPSSISISGGISGGAFTCTSLTSTGTISAGSSSITTTGAITAGSITAGTINGSTIAQIKRECVYLQVAPYTEPPSATGTIMTFRIPALLNGRHIKQVGYYRPSSGTTMTGEIRYNGTNFKTISGTGSGSTSDVNVAVATGGIVSVYLSATGTDNGLDVWFEVE